MSLLLPTRVQSICYMAAYGLLPNYGQTNNDADFDRSSLRQFSLFLTARFLLFLMNKCLLYLLSNLSEARNEMSRAEEVRSKRSAFLDRFNR